MSKLRRRNAHQKTQSSLSLEMEEILDRLTVGNWMPNIDICETKEAVTIRVELPGIEPADIRLTIQDRVLRVQGNKREPEAARERLSYYCLERRYGRFDRQISLDQVVDAGRSRARLCNGVLTVEVPRIAERRGVLFEVPIATR